MFPAELLHHQLLPNTSLTYKMSPVQPVSLTVHIPAEKPILQALVTKTFWWWRGFLMQKYYNMADTMIRKLADLTVVR